MVPKQKTLKLRAVPNDVNKIILEEQGKKKMESMCQFSQEQTIYMIIRKSKKNTDGNLSEAMQLVIEEMRKDQSEGSYYYSWQANIAMAIYDEFKERTGAGVMDIAVHSQFHDACNAAAKRFLNTLIK